MTASTILLIDDDPLLRRSLQFSLQRAGYAAMTAGTAAEGFALARSSPPDLVLLDIGLPGMDGLDALQIMRKQFKAPVLLLTARRGEQDEVRGLELGADDYIRKPFDNDVLLARLRTALRRQAGRPAVPALETITAGNVVIDPRGRSVRVCGEALDITPRSFDVLHLLAREAGSVVTFATLLTEIWGPQFEGEPQVLYVHIRWLREKLECYPGSGVRIVTVHRVGYKLAVEAS